MTDSLRASASTIADGGQAFPSTVKSWNDHTAQDHGGMSLLDWFAGQALPTVVKLVNDCPTHMIEGAGVDISDTDAVSAYVARKSYQLARAMLAERVKHADANSK